MVELRAGHVVVPGNGWQGAFGVKDVGRGAVVDDDSVLEVAVEAREVLHEDTVEERAVLSEQSIRGHTVFVQVVQKRVCVLRKASSVYDNFVE